MSGKWTKCTRVIKNCFHSCLGCVRMVCRLIFSLSLQSPSLKWNLALKHHPSPETFPPQSPVVLCYSVTVLPSNHMFETLGNLTHKVAMCGHPKFPFRWKDLVKVMSQSRLVVFHWALTAFNPFRYLLPLFFINPKLLPVIKQQS